MNETGDAPTEATASESKSPDPLRRTVLIGGAALLISLAVTVLFVLAITRRVGPQPRLALYVSLRVLVSTFNAILLVVLTGIYVQIYRKLPNRFTLSLLLVNVALLLYSVTSNPLLHVLLNFRGSGLGPFTFLPDLFASVAIVVLLYQSYN